MTSSDDSVARIDEVLHDYTVSADAMRSRPAAEDGASADVCIVDEDVQRPRLTLSREVRQLLIARLVDNHGLTRLSAYSAVLAVEQGRDSRYAHLVRAEARAVVDETVQRIRAAMQPAMEAAAHALRAMAEALQQAAGAVRSGEWVDTNGDPVQAPERPRPPLPRRQGRPAWQTPYGPARRPH
ncbi:hypothetical protein [Streptomyces flavofungini]|uniref:hypothetical protein n=1 Tax=Streptomyces flavofungini TaxID=68200 RepID=UPI0034DF3E30